MKTINLMKHSRMMLAGLSFVALPQAVCAQDLSEVKSYLQLNFDHQTKRDFEPLDPAEFMDPMTSMPLSESDIVLLEKNGQFEPYYAGEAVKFLNRFEQALNSIGETLREGDPKAIITQVANPDLWLRQVRSATDLDLEKMATNFNLNESKCGSVSAATLGTNPLTGQTYQDNDSVSLGGKRIKVKDLVPKLNQQEKIFCGLGLTMFDSLGGGDMLNEIMAKRDALMEELGLTEDNPLFQMTQWVTPANIEAVKEQLKSVQDALKNPTPEKIFTLATTASELLPPELQLPAVPTFPQTVLERRYDLDLQKSYQWPGFTMGDRSSALIYANAWAELRGGQKQEGGKKKTIQSFQGQAVAGLKLFEVLDQRIFEATLDSYMDDENARGLLKFCIIGACIEKKGAVKDFKIEEGDDRALYKDWAENYAQQFSVGPIPCVLRVGGSFTGQVGWGLGINLLSVHANTFAAMNAKAYGEASVGVQDVIEAGVGGEVSLIEARADLRGEAAIKFRGSGYPVIEGALTGDSHIGMLNGRLYGFAFVDPMGPLGELLEGIIDTIKDLGDAAQSILKNVAAVSPKAAKIVQDFANNIGGQVSKGIKKLKKKFKCCAMGVPKTTIDGLRVRYEVDLVNWEGYNDDRRFLNYKIFVGPEGRKIEGDANTFNHEQVAVLEQISDLDEKEKQLVELESSVKVKESQIFKEIATFVNSDEARQVSGVKASILKEMAAVNQKKDAVVETVTK
ncbi:MAG TPA: hypothetical protein VE954_18430 [Oligoflexus sp.]|uniref:hypothetical protein n=1 Tax=Oligoflexus sp. TaxID=1971216 RepID=UPI002D458D97|nr:hypothetical protein [Oligoflexus sp.]HYX35079.1 hypothetical protein [Oligoflexus sp.]